MFESCIVEVTLPKNDRMTSSLSSCSDAGSVGRQNGYVYLPLEKYIYLFNGGVAKVGGSFKYKLVWVKFIIGAAVMQIFGDFVIQLIKK